MQFLRFFVAGAFLLFLETPAEAQVWSNWISDEEGKKNWARCGERGGDGWINGIQCDGRYCDDMRVTCEIDGYEIDTSVPEFQFGYMVSKGEADKSYKQEGQMFCPDGMFINSLGCDTDSGYCGAVSGTCSAVLSGSETITVPGNCEWSQQKLSEEDGVNQFVTRSDRLIAGFECSGDHCDDKQFYICQVYDGSVPVVGEWHLAASSYDATVGFKVVSGRVLTSGNSTTRGLELEAGVSVEAKGVGVNASSTASQENTINTENSNQTMVETDVNCNFHEDKPTTEVWHFVLGNAQPETFQQTQQTRCHSYGADQESNQKPKCWPLSCSTSDPYCQVCTDSGEVTSIEGLNVDALYVPYSQN